MSRIQNNLASELAEPRRRGVRQQFLIATHRNSAPRATIRRAHWFWPRLCFGLQLAFVYASRPESRLFHASVERAEKPWAKSLTIDVASTRLMNESIGQTCTRGLEAYRCFQFFDFFFRRLPTYSLRDSDCKLRWIPCVGRSAGFCFSTEYWNIGIIRHVDPILSKMKERLWFTVCHHWFRYLCAPCVDKSTSPIVAEFIPWKRKTVFKSACFYLTFSVARSLFFRKESHLRTSVTVKRRVSDLTSIVADCNRNRFSSRNRCLDQS